MGEGAARCRGAPAAQEFPRAVRGGCLLPGAQGSDSLSDAWWRFKGNLSTLCILNPDIFLFTVGIFQVPQEPETLAYTLAIITAVVRLGLSLQTVGIRFSPTGLPFHPLHSLAKWVLKVVLRELYSRVCFPSGLLSFVVFWGAREFIFNIELNSRNL